MIEYRKRAVEQAEPNQPGWLVVIPVLIVFGVFLGLPSSYNSEIEFYPPSSQVESWWSEDGEYVCWEILTCCEPNKRSTCRQFPFCVPYQQVLEKAPYLVENAFDQRPAVINHPDKVWERPSGWQN